ncbi:hypothetical protein FRB93_005371 [Tulasnella sp. JGI-2019a]|nr:hypothetical protein FRB93_005371 [Tulasnella sp. JGI-2019a]
MPPKRRACEFHRQGKCNKGSQCSFLHIGPPGAAKQNAPNLNQNHSDRGHSDQNHSDQNHSNASAPPGPSRKPPVNGPPMGVCRIFFESGQCKFGTGCRYRHDRPGDTNTASRSRHQNQPSESSSNTKVPHGLCREYYESGKCALGFECRFKHAQASQQKRRGAPNVVDYEVPHAEGSNALKPNEIHNAIKRFNSPTFKFNSSLDMYVYAAALSSAKEENGYDFSDANTLLNMVGDPNNNYFTLVNNILRHESVSIAAGRSKTDLSFQRGYIPILSYLSSNFVIRSTLHQSVNALYGLIDVNFDRIASIVETCIENSMEIRSFREGERELGGLTVFRCVTLCLNEYAERYKRAVPSHPSFAPLVRKLFEWFNEWSEAIASTPPKFDDPICTMNEVERRFLTSRLHKSVVSLMDLVDQAEGYTNRILERGKSSKTTMRQEAALLSALEMAYEGPGQHRRGGPRHDNDLEDITDIKIAPTHNELCSSLLPYLPANVPGGPHHLPVNSMAKVVDIQFRLLREELIAPIRSSLGHVMEALGNPVHSTSLTKLLASDGGLYKSPNDGSESAVFSVYTGVEFKKLSCDINHGLSIEILFNAPAGRARQATAAARAAYWESVGRKRLMQGGLVALVWKTGFGEGDTKIYLGIITSFLDDLIQSTKQSNDRVALKISFLQPEANMRILASLQRGGAAAEGRKCLVEAPIMFESIRPFLETLKQVTPTSIPFARYLAHPENGTLQGVQLQLPAYACVPNFSVDLSCLFNTPTQLKLHPSDPGSVERARLTLKAQSRLDPSQADAVLNTLVSEVSMIQGPPGTGKSFCGTEILHVLVANKIRPILMIAFTNHALDNILLQVLDKGITDKIVRLGAHSKDEVIVKYGLKELMKTATEAGMGKAASKERWKLKQMEKEMGELMAKIVRRHVPIHDIGLHLKRQYPNHLDELENPPFWVDKLFDDAQEWENADGRPTAATLLQFWIEGSDLAFITPPQPPHDDQRDRKRRGKRAAKVDYRSQNQWSHLDESPQDDEPSMYERQLASWKDYALSFFEELGFFEIPNVPATTRSIQDGLHHDWEVWKMSSSERRCLYDFWVNDVREMSYAQETASFDLLNNRHAEARARYEGFNDETKLEILSKRDIIGCTTNGAAKLTSLLKSVAPKVLLVEEAGQVLEAHIIASLVPSIEQMILIGDPKQLRPTLANYHLSMDNKRTGPTYRFDQSLMERLSGMGLHMSRLDVQRRMRPSISHLIRSTLYPHLEDHSLVQEYPHVRGMAKDVFFFDHQHAEEGGGEESASKSNAFEVAMIKDLVMYFLRQGIYSQTGDIVVLCAYLGQLQKIRLALAKEVTTVIDDRDAAQLVDHEEQEDEATVLKVPLGGSAEQVQVSRRVLLRTVDNFQGEEGTIVILSLVRNSGTAQTARRGGIGFLKSNNRANVALSRARHGLYILGNADDLSSQSGMWKRIVQELTERDCLGPALPIACNRHPETVKTIDKPGQLPFHAPDGGCHLPCDARLSCGHHCPFKCHSDDEHHRFTRCNKPCTRLCPRSHPCDQRCSDPCGKCRTQVPYALACGHLNYVECWMLDNPEEIACSELVEKQLVLCEHWARMTCSTDPADFICRSICNGNLHCCNKKCQGQCGRCQGCNPREEGAGISVIIRARHASHLCKKLLYCQHECNGQCSDNHDCSDVTCGRRCRQACPHHECNAPCSVPCAPCMELCPWSCKHYRCPVSCGAPCARLPCDERCANSLKCGHRCPSVCGEPCESQICADCGPATSKDQVVDMLMGSKLSEIDPHGEEPDSMVITLACKHIFTVETLDGICELQNYYRQDSQGRWTDLAPPPEGLQKAPTCPLCRGPITCRRYGRVFKRADLDRSEQNVANTSRRSIQDVLRGVERFDVEQGLKTLTTSLGRIIFRNAPGGKKVGPLRIQRPFLSKASTLPVDIKTLGKQMLTHERLPVELEKAWDQTMYMLFKAYNQAVRVAENRSAHVRAYEAAVTTLHHRYLAEYKEHPELLKEGIRPEAEALMQAMRHCGLPAPPRADMRFRVEAFWATMHIRFLMVRMAQDGIETMKNHSQGFKTAREAWMDFVDFLIGTIEHDAKIAINLSQDSQSHRQVVKTTVLLMDAQYTATQHAAARHVEGAPDKILEGLKSRARNGSANAKRTIAETSRAYRNAMGGRQEDQLWVHENFVLPGNDIVDRWESLIERLNRGVFYTTVSDEEKREILKAFTQNHLGMPGFSARGHFYQCPNGHAYVITECGGAMEQSRCPECGATIGGGGHQLNSSNTVATDFEALAQQQGLPANPWGFGQ